jgi:broad specificity phosphatase PhoE
MPAVLLVRHAQASFGGTDYDVLSELGADQAAAARVAVSRLGGDGARLVSGSLRRQRDTALPWTDAGETLEEDPRWNEYDSADVLGAHSVQAASLDASAASGGAPALSSRDFQAILDEALLGWVDAGADGPASEPWPAFLERVLGGLHDLVASLGSGETAVVFTSGGPIAACCVAALGLPERTFVAFNHVVINGAVTKLVSGRRGLSLISFNEHAHLPPDLVTYR